MDAASLPLVLPTDISIVGLADPDAIVSAEGLMPDGDGVHRSIPHGRPATWIGHALGRVNGGGAAAPDCSIGEGIAKNGVPPQAFAFGDDQLAGLDQGNCRPATALAIA